MSVLPGAAGEAEGEGAGEGVGEHSRGAAADAGGDGRAPAPHAALPRAPLPAAGAASPPPLGAGPSAPERPAWPPSGPASPAPPEAPAKLFPEPVASRPLDRPPDPPPELYRLKPGERAPSASAAAGGGRPSGYPAAPPSGEASSSSGSLGSFATSYVSADFDPDEDVVLRVEWASPRLFKTQIASISVASMVSMAVTGVLVWIIYSDNGTRVAGTRIVPSIALSVSLASFLPVLWVGAVAQLRLRKAVRSGLRFSRRRRLSVRFVAASVCVQLADSLFGVLGASVVLSQPTGQLRVGPSRVLAAFGGLQMCCLAAHLWLAWMSAENLLPIMCSAWRRDCQNAAGGAAGAGARSAAAVGVGGGSGGGGGAVAAGAAGGPAPGPGGAEVTPVKGIDLEGATSASEEGDAGRAPDRPVPSTSLSTPYASAARPDAMVMDVPLSRRRKPFFMWICTCCVIIAWAALAERASRFASGGSRGGRLAWVNGVSVPQPPPGGPYPTPQETCPVEIAAMVLGYVTLASLGMLYCGFCIAVWCGQRYLWAQPYAPYRRSNVMLRMLVRTRRIAWIVVAVAVPSLISSMGSYTCASARVLLLGTPPTTIIFAVITVGAALAQSPGRPRPDAVLSSWLQAFAWTESALPTASVERLAALPRSARHLVRVGTFGDGWGGKQASAELEEDDQRLAERERDADKAADDATTADDDENDEDSKDRRGGGGGCGDRGPNRGGGGEGGGGLSRGGGGGGGGDARGDGPGSGRSDGHQDRCDGPHCGPDADGEPDRDCSGPTIGTRGSPHAAGGLAAPPCVGDGCPDSIARWMQDDIEAPRALGPSALLTPLPEHASFRVRSSGRKSAACAAVGAVGAGSCSSLSSAPVGSSRDPSGHSSALQGRDGSGLASALQGRDGSGLASAPQGRDGSRLSLGRARRDGAAALSPPTPSLSPPAPASATSSSMRSRALSPARTGLPFPLDLPEEQPRECVIARTIAAPFHRKQTVALRPQRLDSPSPGPEAGSDGSHAGVGAALHSRDGSSSGGSAIGDHAALGTPDPHDASLSVPPGRAPSAAVSIPLPKGRRSGGTLGSPLATDSPSTSGRSSAHPSTPLSSPFSTRTSSSLNPAPSAAPSRRSSLGMAAAGTSMASHPSSTPTDSRRFGLRSLLTSRGEASGSVGSVAQRSSARASMTASSRMGGSRARTPAVVDAYGAAYLPPLESVLGSAPDPAEEEIRRALLRLPSVTAPKTSYDAYLRGIQHEDAIAQSRREASQEVLRHGGALSAGLASAALGAAQGAVSGAVGAARGALSGTASGSSSGAASGRAFGSSKGVASLGAGERRGASGAVARGSVVSAAGSMVERGVVHVRSPSGTSMGVATLTRTSASGAAVATATAADGTRSVAVATADAGSVVVSEAMRRRAVSPGDTGSVRGGSPAPSLGSPAPRGNSPSALPADGGSPRGESTPVSWAVAVHSFGVGVAERRAAALVPPTDLPADAAPTLDASDSTQAPGTASAAAAAKAPPVVFRSQYLNEQYVTNADLREPQIADPFNADAGINVSPFFRVLRPKAYEEMQMLAESRSAVGSEATAAALRDSRALDARARRAPSAGEDGAPSSPPGRRRGGVAAARLSPFGARGDADAATSSEGLDVEALQRLGAARSSEPASPAPATSPAVLRAAMLARALVRRLATEPIWCFETSCKMLYWCFLVYAQDPEVSAHGYSASVALSLYSMHSLEAVRERTRGSRMLAAWGDDAAVVSFRGTATVADVLDDVRVWRTRWPKREEVEHATRWEAPVLEDPDSQGTGAGRGGEAGGDEAGGGEAGSGGGGSAGRAPTAAGASPAQARRIDTTEFFIPSAFWPLGSSTPMVHAGFVKSYEASGLRARIMARIEKILDAAGFDEDGHRRDPDEDEDDGKAAADEDEDDGKAAADNGESDGDAGDDDGKSDGDAGVDKPLGVGAEAGGRSGGGADTGTSTEWGATRGGRSDAGAASAREGLDAASAGEGDDAGSLEEIRLASPDMPAGEGGPRSVRSARSIDRRSRARDAGGRSPSLGGSSTDSDEDAAKPDEGAPLPPTASAEAFVAPGGGRQHREPFRLYLTGHSLGGALATLAAVDVALILKRRKLTADMVKLEVHTFGAPRSGNRAFCRMYKRLVPATWHVINAADTVTSSGKFYGLYKRCGNRILINPRGDLIVRPSYLEQYALRSPGMGSVRDHFLTSYRASYVAILTAQLGRKRLLGGRSAALALLRTSEAAALFTPAGLDDVEVDRLLSASVDEGAMMNGRLAMKGIVLDMMRSAFDASFVVRFSVGACQAMWHIAAAAGRYLGLIAPASATSTVGEPGADEGTEVAEEEKNEEEEEEEGGVEEAAATAAAGGLLGEAPGEVSVGMLAEEGSGVGVGVAARARSTLVRPTEADLELGVRRPARGSLEAARSWPRAAAHPTAPEESALPGLGSPLAFGEAALRRPSALLASAAAAPAALAHRSRNFVEWATADARLVAEDVNISGLPCRAARGPSGSSGSSRATGRGRQVARSAGAGRDGTRSRDSEGSHAADSFRTASCRPSRLSASPVRAPRTGSLWVAGRPSSLPPSSRASPNRSRASSSGTVSSLSHARGGAPSGAFSSDLADRLSHLEGAGTGAALAAPVPGPELGAAAAAAAAPSSGPAPPAAAPPASSLSAPSTPAPSAAVSRPASPQRLFETSSWGRGQPQAQRPASVASGLEPSKSWHHGARDAPSDASATASQTRRRCRFDTAPHKRQSKQGSRPQAPGSSPLLTQAKTVVRGNLEETCALRCAASKSGRSRSKNACSLAATFDRVAQRCAFATVATAPQAKSRPPVPGGWGGAVVYAPPEGSLPPGRKGADASRAVAASTPSFEPLSRDGTVPVSGSCAAWPPAWEATAAKAKLAAASAAAALAEGERGATTPLAGAAGAGDVEDPDVWLPPPGPLHLHAHRCRQGAWGFAWPKCSDET